MAFNNLILLAEETATLGERMGKAGLNTIMGILIVFFSLVFIALVITLEGKIFTAIAKKKAAPKTVAPAPVEEPVAVETVDESNDEEIVAVIMAAIYALEAEAGNDVPADGLVVRSIRRRR